MNLDAHGVEVGVIGDDGVGIACGDSSLLLTLDQARWLFLTAGPALLCELDRERLTPERARPAEKPEPQPEAEDQIPGQESLL